MASASNTDDVDAECWKKAIEEFDNSLDASDPKRVGTLTKKTQHPQNLKTGLSLKDLCALVQRKKDAFEQKQGRAEKWVAKLSAVLIQYGKALDVFIQQYPDITSVVWGTVRVLIVVVAQDNETSQVCGDGLVHVVEGCLRWKSITGLFSPSEDFCQSLVKLYVAVLHFIMSAKHHFEKSKLARFGSALTVTAVKFQERISKIEDLSGILMQQLHIQHIATTLANQKTFNSIDHRMLRLASDADIDEVCRWLWIRTSSGNKQPHPGTCRWLFNTPEYHEWMGGSSRLPIVVLGLPGAGKTTLAYNLVERLNTQSEASNHGAVYSFFFSRNKSVGRYSSTTMISSLLAQVIRRCAHSGLDHHPEIAKTIKVLLRFSRCSPCPHGSSVTLGQLCNWLMIALETQPQPQTVIVDALDECVAPVSTSEKAELQQVWSRLADLTERGKIRLAISSRPEAPAMDLIGDFRPLDMNKHNASDIRKTILDTVRGIEACKSPEEAANRLMKRGGSCFLWCSLALGHLERAHGDRDFQQRLDEFPSEIGATYSLMAVKSTKSFDNRNMQQRKAILSLLAVARDAFPADTLYRLALGENPPSSGSRDRTLVELCRPFVQVNDGYPSFFHESVREFLTTQLGDSDSKGWSDRVCVHSSEADMAERCLNILLEPKYHSPDSIGIHLRKLLSPSSADDIAACEEKPEYRYAAEQWNNHLINASPVSHDLLRLADCFLRGFSFVFWGQYQWTFEEGMKFPYINIKSDLTQWHSRLPEDQRRLVDLSNFFSGPYQELSNWYSSSPSSAHLLQFLALIPLGRYYFYSGQRDKRDQTRETALTGLTEILGAEDPTTLRVRTEHGRRFLDGRQYEKALEEFGIIADIQRRVLDPKDKDLFMTELWRANCLWYLNDFRTSTLTCKSSLEGLRDIITTDTDYLYVSTRFMYGISLLWQGHLQESQAVFLAIYDTLILLYGNEHFFAVSVEMILGCIRRRLGHLDVAIELIEHAYEVRKRIYGPEGDLTLIAASGLIVAYRDAGRDDAAKELLEDLDNLGALVDAPFDLKCQVCHVHALVVYDSGEVDEARDMLQGVLVGIDREQTTRSSLWARLSLAQMLRETGDESTALALFDNLVRDKPSNDRYEEIKHSLVLRTVDDEPDPPEVLRLAEEALKLVRSGKVQQADEMLARDSLEWVRRPDFWMPPEFSPVDSGSMKGP